MIGYFLVPWRGKGRCGCGEGLRRCQSWRRELTCAVSQGHLTEILVSPASSIKLSIPRSLDSSIWDKEEGQRKEKGELSHKSPAENSVFRSEDPLMQGQYFWSCGRRGFTPQINAVCEDLFYWSHSVPLRLNRQRFYSILKGQMSKIACGLMAFLENILRCSLLWWLYCGVTVRFMFSPTMKIGFWFLIQDRWHVSTFFFCTSKCQYQLT